MAGTHDHRSGGPLDYNHIANGIYIGTNQCCALGLSEVLKKEGVTIDVSLEESRLDQPFGVAVYLWLPTPDHSPPSKDQLTFGAQTLGEALRQRRKVYVHCKNGHGRAPTLAAAYFISTGKTPDEAFALIKEGRPAAHLRETQYQALEAFASAFKGV